jgi:hypothetical protein
MFVAVTALQRRREHEQALSMAEARALRFESERDAARTLAEALRASLIARAPEAVSAMDTGRGWWALSKRAQVNLLQQWINAVSDDASREVQARSARSDSEKARPLV